MTGTLTTAAVATAGLLGAGALAGVAHEELRPASAAAQSEKAFELAPFPGRREAIPVRPPRRAEGLADRRRPRVLFHRRLDPEQMLARRDEFHSALAEELGVTPEEVTDAFGAVFSDRLDQAVEEGRLTRAQADRILQGWESGEGPPGPIGTAFGHPGDAPPPPMHP